MKNRVMTKKGIVQGIPEGISLAFKGIPYAKAPVGELRWKAPVEMDPWEGVLHCDHFPNMCMQELPTEDNPFTAIYKREFYSNRDFLPPMSEDCLYINIWTPAEQTGEKLPVAFWIHGGGFGGGYSSEVEFDGEPFCKKGVILVTVEYRCGLFGFFSHPWLDAENEQGISGNYGTLDQIAALKWVYENIEAFGGDPQNITVFGQSAGAMSTQDLVSSPLTGDMIARAILQSGLQCEENFLYCPTMEQEQQMCAAFVEASGCKSLEELRAVPAQQVNEMLGVVNAKGFEMGVGLCVVPNKDGYVLPQTVKEAYAAGTFKKIPYMAGCVTDDLATSPENVQAGKPGILMDDTARWCLKCEELGIPGYAYHFKHELPKENGEVQPSFHSAEIWYTHGTLGRSWRPMTEADYQTSDEVMTYWTNFMKTGNPASGETEAWPAYTKENPFVKVL